MQNKLIVKLATIVGVSIALLIPLFLIGGQISVRSAHQSEVLQEISASAASAQILLGPLCVVRYHELIEHVEKDSITHQETIHRESTEGYLVLPPKTLDIRGEARVETRSRGIYHARLYHSALQISGEVVIKPGIDFAPQRRILDAQAFLVVGISDPRGISNDPTISLNGEERHFNTGTLGIGPRSGVQLSLGLVDIAKGNHFSFAFPLNIMGSDRLSIAAAGDQTTVALKSDWPHPSFQGRFLPNTRSVSEHGFEARWQISALARSFERVIDSNIGANGATTSETLEIGFLEPVNIYLMSARAVNYGILFVVLIFAAFFLTEILRRLRIHPLQYLLVGLALAIFFLLLTALSEHVSFGLAYGISAGACVALIGIYLVGALGQRILARYFTVGIGLLYAVLYGVLLSEDNALLMGSIILFAALGLTMLATRRLDWYGVEMSANANSQSDSLSE